MEQDIKSKLLACIGEIYDQSKECKLESAFFEKINPELESLVSYFGITKKQAFFLAIVFVLNYEKDDKVGINDLGKHFDCNPLILFDHRNDLTALVRKGILKSIKPRYCLVPVDNEQYVVEENICKAIISNLPLSEIESYNYTDSIDVIDNICLLGTRRNEREIASDALFEDMNKIIETAKQFTFIQKLIQMNLKDADKYLLILLCWHTIVGMKGVSLGWIVEIIFNEHRARITFIQQILSKENELIKKGLVEIENAESLDYILLSLTKYAREFLSLNLSN